MSPKVKTVLPAAGIACMRQAMAALEREDFATAEPLFMKLNRQWPDFPDAWHFHGLLRHRAGEPEKALPLLDKAEELAPDSVPFLVNRARICNEQGHRDRALGYLDRAHRLAPEHAQVLVAMSQLLFEAQRGGEIVGELERQLPRAPRDWYLPMILAQCREQGGDRAGAMAAFEQAARLAPPGEAAPLIMLGEAARRNSDYVTAEDAYRRALACNPKAAGAYLGLGHLALQSGDFERAEEQLRLALAHDPNLDAAWEALSAMASGAKAAALCTELDVAVAAAAARPDAWLLHFARARLRERLGDYDGAFADYVEGNRPRSPGERYSPEAQVAYTRNLIEHLGPDFVSRDIGPGADAPRPIFICGMQRSGTTLVETILATHPEVAAGGEMRYIHDRLMRTLGARGLTRTGEWLAAQSDAELGAMARDWQSHLRTAASGRARVTDKMPGNYALLGLIHLCLPQAAIVHVHRDPRDNCFSCFATPFQESYLFSSTLESMAQFYRLYERFMVHWRQLLGAGRIIEIEYEQLIADPEGEVRRLLAALDLAWDSRCLDFHKTARDVRTASVYQVRQPLYSTSVGRWRHFERHLGPLIEGLEAPPPL